MDETFGEPISVYGAEQAIEDGVLVHPYPDRWPWLLLTIGVHAAIEEAIKGTERTYDQAAVPLCQDAIMIAQAGQKKDPNEYLWTKGLEGNVTGQTVWIGMNEKGGITLMFPEER
jgi:hypothetical protein